MRRTVGVLAITFTALEAADSFLTMWAVNHGYTEVNILMAPIAHTWWVAVIKILPAALVGWLAFWAVGRFPKTSRWIILGLAAVSVLLVVVIVSNLMEIL